MSESSHFCPYCGAALTPDMRFCGACGRPLGGMATPAPKKRGWLIPVLAVALACIACLCLGGAGLLAWNYIPNARQVFAPSGLPVTEATEIIPNPITTQVEEITSNPTQAMDETETPVESTLPAPTTPPGKTFDYQGIHFIYDPALASQMEPTTVEAIGADMGATPPTPQHLEINLNGYPLQGTFHQPRIIIYSVDDFLTAYPDSQQLFDELNKVLVEQPEQPGQEGLPFLPYFNAGQIFTAQVKYLNGKGVRYLTQYAQYFAPINNHDVFYTYQGFAGDGKYYISAILPVNHPGLQNDDSIPNGDFDTFSNNYTQYIDGIRATLNAETAGSFTPSLDLLDQMVESIEVK